MRLTSAVRPAAAVVPFLLAIASEASGQACMGQLTNDREFAVGGAVGFTDGATNYGGGFGANLAGPLSVQIQAGLTSFDAIDPNGVGFDGSLGYELPVVGASVCPIVGVGYFRISGSVSQVTGSLSQITVPIGIGVGRTVYGNGNFGVTLFAQPTYMYIRLEGSLSGQNGGSFSTTESFSEFGATIGSLLGFGSFFVGGGVSMSTTEGTDPTFSLGAGFIVGPARSR